MVTNVSEGKLKLILQGCSQGLFEIRMRPWRAIIPLLLSSEASGAGCWTSGLTQSDNFYVPMIRQP